MYEILQPGNSDERNIIEPVNEKSNIISAPSSISNENSISGRKR